MEQNCTELISWFKTLFYKANLRFEKLVLAITGINRNSFRILVHISGPSQSGGFIESASQSKYLTSNGINSTSSNFLFHQEEKMHSLESIFGACLQQRCIALHGRGLGCTWYFNYALGGDCTPKLDAVWIKIKLIFKFNLIPIK